MKIINTKIIVLTILIMLMSFSLSYAKTETYEINDEYIFTVTDKIPKNAYAKVNVGNINITQYSNGKAKISPYPDKVIEDKYGNKILRYDYDTLQEYIGQEFKITIKKDIITNDSHQYTVIDLEKENFTNYLSAIPRIECDNPYIIATANDITKDCTTDLEKLEKIYDYVNMYLTYDTSDTYRNKGALSALLTGRGVCEEYTTLFTAMCRVCEIPTRILTGYNAENLVLGEKTESIDSYHAWSEVYIEDKGWVPLEITAEYYKNGEKEVYKDGFLKLSNPENYVVEGVYNSELNELEWYGLNLEGYSKYITLIKETYFPDIEQHWAKGNIEHLYKSKIINGYENGTFLPDNNVTRAEYICMLSRIVESLKMDYYDIEDIYYTHDFEDNWVKKDYDRLMKYYAFYAQDFEKGAGHNTISYVFGDTFDMNKEITREEVVALLAPFLKYEEGQDVPLTDIEDSNFKKEIIISYINNVIVGYEDNTFKPQQTITRAEIATIFDRMISKEK